MGKFKNLAFFFAAFIIFFYIVYLLILPNVINLSFAKDMVKSIAKEQFGINVEIGNLKLLTGFPLKAGAQIDEISVICADGTKALDIKTAKADADIFPLLFKKIKINNAQISGLTANSDISKEGKLSLEKCIIMPAQQQEETKSTPTMDFSLDNKLPNIKLSDILFNLKDTETSNILSLNLEQLFISKFILNKHIAADAKGQIQLNETPNINFNLKVDSFLPKLEAPSGQTTTPQASYINFVKEFAKYNLLADIKSDLKITNSQNVSMNGFVDINGLSFKINDTQLPTGFVRAKFSDKQGELNSRIYISEQENFALDALIKNSKNLDMEASFITDKISLKNLQTLALALLNSLNIKNDFATLQTNGHIISNLKFKANAKTIESSGSFRLADGEIISKPNNLYITKINSNINVENNALNISNTSALINNALLEIKGNITKDTDTDIKISANQMPLSKLSSTFLTGDLKKNYEIKNGILNINLFLKGKLAEIKPSVNATIESLEILDKFNKITLSNKNSTLNLVTDGKTFNGTLKLLNTFANFAQLKTTLSVPELITNITAEKIDLNNTTINLNNSKLNLIGSITNYLQKPEFAFNLSGNILANDLTNFLPKELTSSVLAKGIIPLKARINGSDQITLRAQVLADKNNNINLLTIKELSDTPSIINADITVDGANLTINDIGIYSNTTNSLTEDFNNNISTGNELIKITGNLMNGEILKNTKVLTTQKLGVSFLNINTDIDTNLDIFGNINFPTIKGNINLSNINAPDYLIKGQLANINITPNIINADIYGLNLNDSILDINFNAVNSFEMPFKINSMKVNSDNIDLDKILVITTKFPQPSTNPSTNQTQTNTPMIPVYIQNGIAQIGKFKVGTIEADNISADFTLKDDILNLKTINAKAFNGNLTGNLSYDLKKLLLNAKLAGTNMDANPAVTALIGIKDQILGTLKFDADISMSGATMTEQLNSLSGSADFEVTNGQLGNLGKIETYLKAANIVSSKFIKSSINSVINTILPYNSGQITKAEGKLTFSNGNAYFKPITTTGKEMSLYVNGYLNMLNYNGDIKILGRLNQELVNALGPIGNLSVDKVLSYIPQIGTSAAVVFESFNTPIKQQELNEIPQLTPVANNKSFKVIIQGNTMSTNAVKSFQWLATEDVINATENAIEQTTAPVITKEELNTIQTNIQKQAEEKLNEVIEKNETLQKIKTFGEFLKNTSTQQE